MGEGVTRMIAEVASDARSQNDPDTLKLVYEIARDRLLQQSRDIDALNQKATAIMVAASLAVAIPTAVHAMRSAGWPLNLLLTLGGVVYVVLLLAVGFSYWGRAFHFPPDTTVLRDDWLDATPSEVFAGLITDLTKAFTINARLMAAKSNWVNVALICLITEAVILAVGAYFL